MADQNWVETLLERQREGPLQQLRREPSYQDYCVAQGLASLRSASDYYHFLKTGRTLGPAYTSSPGATPFPYSLKELTRPLVRCLPWAISGMAGGLGTGWAATDKALRLGMTH